MNLVTGPTGNVGSALLPRLQAAGVPVRALAHSAASRDAIERCGARVVEGDFDRPDTLEAAMAGCDRLFLLSPPSPAQVEREKSAIDAAGRAGVGHVVALSVTGSDRASPVPFLRWHGEIDEHLLASGLDYTILRPAGFMQVHMLPAETVRAHNAWFGMTGVGVGAWIDVGDVAAAAAAVLTSPGHIGRTYELTGPAALSMPDAAALLSEAIGRDVAWVEIPPAQFEANLLAVGLPAWMAEAAVLLYQWIREGRSGPVTNTVEELTGERPRSYREFLEEHKNAFSV